MKANFTVSPMQDANEVGLRQQVVKIDATESPAVIQARLEEAGLKPITVRGSTLDNKTYFDMEVLIHPDEADWVEDVLK